MQTLKETIEVSKFSLIKTSDIIAKQACLFQISPKGFYVRLNRKDLPKNLRSNLTLRSICNLDVTMHLPQLNFGLDGTITQTQHIGGGVFELFIRFFDNVPSYWSDCLMDMLLSYPKRSFTDEFEILSSKKKNAFKFKRMSP